MKSLALLLTVVAVALAVPGLRNKRFAVGTISISAPTNAGTLGCVVTGNVLYANGFKLRELTSDEQTELEDYRQKMDDYRTALKALVAEKQKQLQERLKSKSVASVGTTAKDDVEKPQVPTKPSFCNSEDTTQYIFDGCMVQNNKVYVGREYARDLTADEIEELAKFDVAQTAYQKYIQEHVNKQVKELFETSDLFSALFSEGGAHHKEAKAEEEEATTRSSAVTTTEAAPEAPVVPNFCTAIY